MWRVVLCDIENLLNEEALARLGLSCQKRKIVQDAVTTGNCVLSVEELVNDELKECGRKRSKFTPRRCRLEERYNTLVQDNWVLTFSLLLSS